MPAAPVSYASLLRRRPTFRRIWLGDVVSLTGDWFTTISLLSMMLELTGKGEAVAAVLVARFLPALLFGSVAGVVADRVDRRAVLVACDVLRAAVVLGFLRSASAGTCRWPTCCASCRPPSPRSSTPPSRRPWRASSSARTSSPPTPCRA
jgi:MFS family permease